MYIILISLYTQTVTQSHTYTQRWYLGLLPIIWRKNWRRLMRSAYCLSVYSFVSVHLSVYPPQFLLGRLWYHLAVCVCVCRLLCLCPIHSFFFHAVYVVRKNEGISTFKNFVFTLFSTRLQRIIAKMSALDSPRMPSCLSISKNSRIFPDLTLENFPDTYCNICYTQAPIPDIL
jgi:hypothetical protein